MEYPSKLAARAMTERRLQAEELPPAGNPYLAGVNSPGHGSFTPDPCSEYSALRMPFGLGGQNYLAERHNWDTALERMNAALEVRHHD